MAGDAAGDPRDIEDVLDRLEAWHRRSAGAYDTYDAPEDDRSEVPARR